MTFAWQPLVQSNAYVWKVTKDMSPKLEMLDVSVVLLYVLIG
jgi:hypothetical protein